MSRASRPCTQSRYCRASPASPQRVPIQAVRHESLHVRRAAARTPLRRLLGVERGEHAGARAGHRRRTVLPQPLQMPRHFGIAPAHHRLEVVAALARAEKARILIGVESRVNSGSAKIAAVDTATRRHQDEIPGRRQLAPLAGAPRCPRQRRCARTRTPARRRPAAGASSCSSARDQPSSHRRLSASSVVAASELPPPSPPPSGRRFSQRDVDAQRACRRSAAAGAPRARVKILLGGHARHVVQRAR